MTARMSFFFISFQSFRGVDGQSCDPCCCTAKGFSYTRTHIKFFFRLFSHIDNHRMLGRVPCARQQVPVGQSFHRPQCACANPTPPVHPSPPYLSPQVTISLFSKSVSLFLFCRYVHLYLFFHIPCINDTI